MRTRDTPGIADAIAPFADACHAVDVGAGVRIGVLEALAPS
jgi:hypothetical protein